MNATTPDPRRGRRRLLLVVLFFAAPVIAAVVAAMTGFVPEGRRNRGELLAPPIDYRGVRARPAVGWADGSGTWHWLLRAPADCGAPCARTVDALRRVRLMMHRHSARVRIVYAGVPDAALATVLADAPEVLVTQLDGDVLPRPPAPRDEADPRRANLPVEIVDPHGYVVLRYAAGQDLTDVRKDLARLIR